MSFCLWVTGLPGSGKSTITKELEGMLADAGIDFFTLSLDRIRRIVTPEPKYTEEERDIVYRALVVMAQLLVEGAGKNVILDATGNRREYRKLARRLITEFAEVYVDCPIETAMRREASRPEGAVRSGLYRKASEGKLDGGLPGFSAPYEAPERPEVRLDTATLSPCRAAAQVMEYIRARWGG